MRDAGKIAKPENQISDAAVRPNDDWYGAAGVHSACALRRPDDRCHLRSPDASHALSAPLAIQWPAIRLVPYQGGACDLPCVIAGASGGIRSEERRVGRGGS